MTKLEIVKEILSIYAKDRQQLAREDGRCVYLASDGRKCAIGQALKEPQLWKNHEGGLSTLLETGIISELDTWLKPQYRGHPIRFWVALQVAHDFWIENFRFNELAKEIGISELDELKQHLNLYTDHLA